MGRGEVLGSEAGARLDEREKSFESPSAGRQWYHASCVVCWPTGGGALNILEVTGMARTATGNCPGGALVFQGGYHPRKKLTKLGSFFRTKLCTRVHRLGYQKHAKLQKRVWKSYTNTCLGCVTRTCWNHMSRMFFFCFFLFCFFFFFLMILSVLSEFDKIPGYWGVRTFQASRGY